MPSFDTVCEADVVEVKNGVENTAKEITTRFDFKGTSATIEFKDKEITLIGDSDFQLAQIDDILRNKLTKRNVDIRFLDKGDVQKMGGDKVKQIIKVRNGIASEDAKKIQRVIKDSKMKVQAAIQGEAVRITGAKRDDLQAAMALIRKEMPDLPLSFDNFRDYKFAAMGRFDYTKADCFAFHEAIKTQIVPLVKEIQAQRLQKLGKTKFKPWDLDVDPEGKPALKPFKDGSEMLRGTIAMFERIDPYFGNCLRIMDQLGHLDLDSKPGKAPGGYNYPLYEIGVPFIFMNAVGTQRDLETMVHEGGHAIHSFLSRDLKLTAFKNLPSEVAELASMSMELLSMPQWSEFYDETAHQRAMREQIEGTLKVLPWIAQIDAFQHWIYENPSHSLAERAAFWCQLSADFGTGLTDWTDYEDLIECSWQRQLHLFEVPFYYIEYGIAQLGALGVWKNSLEDYPKAIEQYKNALALGYTAPMAKIYETAGVPFDFSSGRLRSLADLIQLELKKMN